MTVIALSQQKGKTAVRGLKSPFHVTISEPTRKALTATHIRISKSETWESPHIKRQQISAWPKYTDLH